MSGGTYDFVVMGGGHNGLLSSIYLAKAGYKVCVLEALDEFGGGTRSGEIAPGYIADQGGMVHNLISRTPIVREDELSCSRSTAWSTSSSIRCAARSFPTKSI